MKRISAALAAVAVATLGTLAVAAPASAHHNKVNATVTVEGCELTGTSSWSEPEGPNDHRVDNTELVVLVDGTVHHALIGTPIDVDLPAGTTEVKWRVWGGGERDYDDPVLLDLAALVDYLDADDANSPLDAEAPGVDWYTEKVEECPAPEPSPSASPSASETATTTTTEAGKLADTGANLTTVLALGGALMLMGAGVLIIARVRRSGTGG